MNSHFPISEFEIAASEELERKPGLVFALNAESIRQFRPLFDPADFSGLTVHWQDLGGMAAADWEEFLRTLNPEVVVTGWSSRRIPERYLSEEYCALRYVCHLTGSVREVVSRALIEKGVLVTNWGTSISHTIAEHAILLVLGALRNMPQWRHFMGDWSRRRVMPTMRLRGKRVGLHGFGAVARELTALLKPFGVALSAYSPGVPPEILQQHEVRSADSLESLFTTSEILIECEALTPATQGSVNEKVLRHLPSGAVFVNVGRGRVVDEEALAKVAMENGLRLGIDVYHEEPPSPESALLQVPDAIFSPHIAGPTMDAFPLLWEFALTNLTQYLQGKELQGQVTPDVFDRST